MSNEIKELQERIQALENKVEMLEANAPEDQISMVVFSGDLDKMLASFIIATASAAMFDKVVMFFTFWGSPALRDLKKKVKKDDFMAKMFGKMLPKGASKLKLSKMHMAGMGTRMIKSLMRKHNVLSLEELMKSAADNGVQIYLCEMTMNLMGFKMEEFIDYPNIKVAGAAKFLQEAGNSKATLFI